MKHLYFHRTKNNRLPKVVRVKTTQKLLYHRFSFLILAITKKNQSNKLKQAKPDTSQYFSSFVYLSIEKQKAQLDNLVSLFLYTMQSTKVTNMKTAIYEKYLTEL